MLSLLKIIILDLKCYNTFFLFFATSFSSTTLIRLWKLKHLSKTNTSKIWLRYIIIYTFEGKKVIYTIWRLWSQLSSPLFFVSFFVLFGYRRISLFSELIAVFEPFHEYTHTHIYSHHCIKIELVPLHYHNFSRQYSSRTSLSTFKNIAIGKNLFLK